MARGRVTAAGLGVVLTVSMASGQVRALATPDPVVGSAVPAERSVPVHAVAGRDPAPLAVAGRAISAPPRVSWPAAGTAEVDLSGSTRGRAAAGLPVRVGAVPGGPASVRVAVLDQAASRAAGLTGLLVRMSRSDGQARPGPVSLAVDYSGFRGAFGGDWASRLRLVRLADGGAVPATNDVRAATLTAKVDVGTLTTFALTAGSSGPAGDFTATSLAPSGSWTAGGSTGDFTWSYPIRVPPVPGGRVPDVSLGYSAQSVDGRVASTNSQPSWVGEGWDVWPGFVERHHKGCADDGVAGVGDLCWGPESVTLSFAGHSGDLVKDDATGAYRPLSDDGSKLEHLTGAANGDNDGEYWKLTTTNGVQYFFGRSALPGGGAATDSAWTAPVFGNNAGEPCHGATFAASSCTQAWRWNLDYVVDPHGDAVAYFYGKESNKYGLNNNSSGTGYVRGGVLKTIAYGFRDGHVADPAPTGPAAQVSFGAVERCASAAANCSGLPANAANYPDAPLDQLCVTAGTAVCSAQQVSPTFFTTKKLTTITTKIRSGTGYVPVESWTLGQSFPDPGDGQSAALWLQSIDHKGLVGGTEAMPPVTFDSIPLENRVDNTSDNHPPLVKERLAIIHTETGADISIGYAPPDCDRAALPNENANTKRCYPTWWSPAGHPPLKDWFHKYVVASVTEADRTAVGQPPVQTTYGYQGGGAWHRSDTDELTKPEHRTISQWRGYQKVVVTKGTAPDVRSQTSTLYMRGMDDPATSSGDVRVTDSEGGTLLDSPWLAGLARESVVFNGVGGAQVSGTITDPVASAPTATHVHDGITVTARRVNAAAERGRVALAAGGFRRTLASRQYDAHGHVVAVSDEGDTATTADDVCTRTGYASNAAKAMFAFPSQVTTTSVRCAATPSLPDDAVSVTRNYYDRSGTLGALPGAGDLTRIDQAASYSGSTPVFVTSARATFDAYGRSTAAADALGRTTSTAYTDTGGLLTKTVVTDPKQFVITTTFEPSSGQPTVVVDVNNKQTDMTYDPLGRLTAAWKPGRPKSSGLDATVTFDYQIRTNAPSVVTTSTLGPNGNYVTSFALYDGLLRPRQTQAPAVGGGRLITDTAHDSRGLVWKTNQPYFNNGTPGTTLVSVNENTDVLAQTVNFFDGAERVTASVFQSKTVEQWRTTTTYGGDRVNVTPPAGGTATTTVTDARGRTTELRQYHGTTPTGTFDATRYGYDPAGQLTSLTDPAGNVWRSTYDLRGRKTSTEDPDAGVTTMAHDDAGQLLSTTDARGVTLAHEYDELGRRTGLFEDSTAGTQLARWTYDTLRKGALTSATRVVNGQSYVDAVLGYDDDGQPLASRVTIPADAGALAGSYTYQYSYEPNGQRAILRLPITPGLLNETLTYRHDDLGNESVLESGQPGGIFPLVPSASYTKHGEPIRLTLSTGQATVFLGNEYDEPTRRVTRRTVEVGGIAGYSSDTTYRYDPAGNVTRTATTAAGGTDPQCFAYDAMRRVRDAWTPTDDCAGGPGSAPFGGPAPYWTTYGYDATGSRTTETRHDLAGGPDTTLTYTYSGADGAQPHTLRQVTTDAPSGQRTDTYGYDEIGSTTSRPSATGQQTLTYDSEGNLATVSTGGTEIASYLYDADGARLIRRDTNGATLYLPHGVEVHADTAGTKTSTRYYTFAGQTVAMRTAQGVVFLGADQHATPTQNLTATNATATTRQLDPFGRPRGAQPAWPDDHGFLGAPTDTTGLTHLGAREYDPALGRFTSIDPVLDPGDPQSLNGYAYADNNPATNHDPNGALCTNGPDGMCYVARTGQNVATPGVSDRNSSPGPDPGYTAGRRITGSGGSGGTNVGGGGNGGPGADDLATLPGAPDDIDKLLNTAVWLDENGAFHDRDNNARRLLGTCDYLASAKGDDICGVAFRSFLDCYAHAGYSQAGCDANVEAGYHPANPWLVAAGFAAPFVILTLPEVVAARGGALLVEEGIALRSGAAVTSGATANTAARQVTVLGRFRGGTETYMGKPGFNVLDLPSKGAGRYWWTRNKRFIDDALDRGDELRLVTNPNQPLYQGGNVYQRELKYLQDRGYRWIPKDDYWVVVPRGGG